MREKEIEKYLVDVVGSKGGLCWKWTGVAGVPDRVCLLPHGEVIFVEVKTSGGKLSRMQEFRHRMMRSIGHRVEVVWSKEDVDGLFD